MPDVMPDGEKAHRGRSGSELRAPLVGAANVCLLAMRVCVLREASLAGREACYIFCDAWRAAAFRGPAVQDDD